MKRSAAALKSQPDLFSEETPKASARSGSVTRAHWPRSKVYADRFRVEDLIPLDLKPRDFRALFIGESPHRDEVSSDDPDQRSPFRGVAGREWWAELSKFLKKPLKERAVPPRIVLLEICAELGIGVMNAVQFPIDPKITMHQGEKSSPRQALGFEKGAGEFGYKAVYQDSEGPVAAAIADLVERLRPFADSKAQLVCLGNDSRWFNERALERLPEGSALRKRGIMTIPHPSSWWRNVAYRAKAVAALQELLG